jgi:predicted nucleotidyltransferase
MTIDLKGLSKEMQDQFPEVLFAIVFGSAASGRIRAGGDVDVAVWLSDTENRMELIPRLTALVEKFSKDAPCDLLFLNNAGPLLSFEALKGKRLFVRDEALDLYAGFYSITCREYEDQIAWMKKQLQYRSYEVQWGH